MKIRSSLLRLRVQAAGPVVASAAAAAAPPPPSSAGGGVGKSRRKILEILGDAFCFIRDGTSRDVLGIVLHIGTTWKTSGCNSPLVPYINPVGTSVSGAIKASERSSLGFGLLGVSVCVVNFVFCVCGKLSLLCPRQGKIYCCVHLVCCSVQHSTAAHTVRAQLRRGGNRVCCASTALADASVLCVTLGPGQQNTALQPPSCSLLFQCSSLSPSVPSQIWYTRFLSTQAPPAPALSTPPQPRCSCRACATLSSPSLFSRAMRLFAAAAGCSAALRCRASTRGAACCATCATRQA